MKNNCDDIDEFAPEAIFGDMEEPEEEIFDPQGLNQLPPYRMIGEAFLIDTEPISYEKQS